MKGLLAVAALLFAFAIQSASAVTVWYQPTPFPSTVNSTIPESMRHYTEGWVYVNSNSVPVQLNNTTLQQPTEQSPWLYVGGVGGYQYLTFIKLNLTGLPAHVDSAIMYLETGAMGSPWSLSPYGACPVLGQWNGISSWAALPPVGQCADWYPTPTAGNWAGFMLSNGGGCTWCDWYNQWQSGALANNGVMIHAQNLNYGMDALLSSAVSSAYDGARPMLGLTFTPPIAVPDFKMPLPGGASWLITNEIGGYECSGQAPWPDTAHQGNNYFSVDIAPTNHDANGNTVYTGNIPVIAAADGTVTFAGWDVSLPGNGYFVVVNHGATGFSTRYLHMKSNLQVSAGTPVTRGQLLGYMGDTGTGNAGHTHLHFGMRYNDSGVSDSNVRYATVDGWLMKSIQTECQNGTWIRFYSSSNTAYPHTN